MIVLSLVLVIAAAVSLFIGLFVATDTLIFIWGAIALCLVSLLLLWLGTRQRKGAEPTSPSAPVYGGAARAGGSALPARARAGDDKDHEGDDVLEETSSDTVVVGDPTDASEAAVAKARAEARALARIAGVGTTQQDALLNQYGSLDEIRGASVDDIVANVRGFNEDLATRVKRALG